MLNYNFKKERIYTGARMFIQFKINCGLLS